MCFQSYIFPFDIYKIKYIFLLFTQIEQMPWWPFVVENSFNLLSILVWMHVLLESLFLKY